MNAGSQHLIVCATETVMYSYAKNVRNLVERSAKAGGATSRIRFLFVISGVPSPINPKRIISNVAATERFCKSSCYETTICIIDDLISIVEII